ncbi:S8 family peptidase [Acinetobacter baumannii]|nr:S8 family peptidase [Acinetobacter baumannii]EKZ2212843.1 S8 family peptidase [Acinetobacter baumannii]EKZ2237979.1 S8 family peptidase [Acinetobacter baumannii]ELA7201993.1 S8 family peptidase [Acinetobacter baumannii]ELA7741840.1 S8 family peptidase [Acinetobacter baumannii]
MERYPLLLLPTPSVTSPSLRPGGGDTIHAPAIAKQAELLSPKFARLESALNRRALEIRQGVDHLNTEYAIVIETYGKVADFFKAVRKIEGLEWLGEYELREITPTEDFYSSDDNRDKPLTGQIMLVLSDRRAIDELLSLWRRYGEQPNMVFNRGWAKFRDLFRLLKDIRYWSVKDRLEYSGVIGYWEQRLKDEPDEAIRFEAELWFQADSNKRELAFNNVIRLVQELDGEYLTTCCIPEIHYQSLLLELPADKVQFILKDHNVSLIKCDQVMMFRPLGQMIIDPLWSEEEETNYIPQIESSEDRKVVFEKLPRVALLDGLPLANHNDLIGNLIIDDPDDFASTYRAIDRKHGTTMASLIVNGDLKEAGKKLSSPLYVRPIMKPDNRSFDRAEAIPDSELPLDIVHRAVKRLFEGEGGEPPVAPSVKVINLSIGDPNIVFNGKMSPFARLLDWLSHKYNVLFLVSAGNHYNNIPISKTASEFRALTDDLRALEFFESLERSAWQRKLLSPAESINSVTVGAIHSDACTLTATNPSLYNLYNEEMPAFYSAQGNGYARAVKPDIVLSGGRILHREPIIGAELCPTNYAAEPGHLVAYPDLSSFTNRRYTRGTSNSTALASRGSGEICDILEELFYENNQQHNFENYASLLIKALLTHGASWGDLYNNISRYMAGADTTTIKNSVVKYIGYGKPDIDRVKYCLENRVTILGYGDLENNEAHLYKLPLPNSFGGRTIWRRLVVTLAWFIEPCPANIKYRDSALWFTLEGENKDFVARRQTSVDWMQVKRGTLQHEIFEGDDLAVLTENGTLEIKVNCKEHAKKMDKPVRYALAISLEVADTTDISLYQDVKNAIELQIIQDTKVQTRI